MPKKMDIDYKQLMKMVKEGTHQNEIMEKFGFKTSTQLKVAIANAAMEEGVLPQLAGGRGTAGGEVSNVIKVNKRGSLVISKKLVESLGIAMDEEFEVRKSAAGLSLRKSEEDK